MQVDQVRWVDLTLAEQQRFAAPFRQTPMPHFISWNVNAHIADELDALFVTP